MRSPLQVSWVVLVGIALLGLDPGAGRADAPSNRPNILLVVGDDLGWADVGYHGARIRTPNIDKLMKAGVELDSHYVQPVCTPTRTALLTGRYPSRFGPQALAPSNLRALPLGTETLASALKSVGYSTHIAGKWHLGSRPEWGPNQFGFDHSYGSLNGAVDPWQHLYRKGPYLRTWHRDGRIFDEEGNATELVAAEASAWIRAKQSPWFVYVPFHAVHIPIDTPDVYKAPYANETFFDDPEKNESYRRFAAFVSQLDAKLGDLIAAVDETDQRGNTLIVFTSDNGGLAGGGNGYISEVPATPVLSSNLPLRGFKAQLYEGGIRVPAFVNWPGKLTPRTVRAPLQVVDWMPTLTNLAGYAPARDLKWDGHDIWPLLTGQVENPAPRVIYVPLKSGYAIRSGPWKLIVRDNQQAELFDLGRDPAEKTDLAGSEPDRVGELKALAKQIQRDDHPELPDDLKGIPG